MFIEMEGDVMFILKAIGGWFISGLLYYPFVFFISESSFTSNDDLLTLSIAIPSVIFAAILIFMGHGRSEGFDTFRAMVVGYSYHAVFWYFTIVTYNFNNAWSAIGYGWSQSIKYLVMIIGVFIIARRVNIPDTIEYIKESKANRHQKKLQHEINMLAQKSNIILKQIGGSLSSLEGEISKTPKDSRNLMLLFTSIASGEESNLLNLRRENSGNQQGASEEIKRLISSIKQLKAVTNKARSYQHIHTLKEQVATFEEAVKQLQASVHKDDSTLAKAFQQEDQNGFYLNKVRQEYQYLTSSFRNL